MKSAKRHLRVASWGLCARGRGPKGESNDRLRYSKGKRDGRNVSLQDLILEFEMCAKKTLSHVDSAGRARMVNVAGKAVTSRRAVAECHVRLSRETLSFICKAKLPKGNALETARLAGIMAAKRTPELIPLCHPLLLTHVDVEAEIRGNGVRFVASVSCKGTTGVEMEALMAASIAALTLYDMVKAVEKGATIEKVRLLEKSGGKSGLYHRSGRLAADR